MTCPPTASAISTDRQPPDIVTPGNANAFKYEEPTPKPEQINLFGGGE